MAAKRTTGQMTWGEIGRREGISGERARQIFEYGMKKLRRKREALAILKFYADEIQRAREGRPQEVPQ